MKIIVQCFNCVNLVCHSEVVICYTEIWPVGVSGDLTAYIAM